MDPNNWNYNLHYGHPASGGLPTSHPSLNRLDLPAGISLGHPLQAATHGTLGGRGGVNIPAMNYSALSVPLLETMSPLTSAIPQQNAHKSMALAQGQFVLDPGVRVSEQASPNLSRFESSSKARDVRANQILEAAAAARVWGTTSLYNQFFPDVSSITTASSSPASVSGNITKAHLQEPPPAHNSSVSRLTAVQRTPHGQEVYSRLSEISGQPGSLNSTIGKQSIMAAPQSSLHRQTPVNIQNFSTHEGIEDLSSNSQSIYSPYANLGPGSNQDFATASLTTDISYEAVSPAPNLTENNPSQQESASFSIAQFPELASLTSEDAHLFADKFQDNDFRLKIDSRLPQTDALHFPQIGSRQDLNMALKIPKDNLQNNLAALQGNIRSDLFHQHNPSQMLGSSQLIVSNALTPQIMHSSLSTTSMQQSQVPPPVQALADSTTKPKRRSRKKKNEANTQPNQSSPKKSNSQISQSVNNLHSQLGQQTVAAPHILNMPQTSLAVSNQTGSPHMTQASHITAQQNYNNQRANTPSMPHNFSLQDQLRNQGDFALPERIREKPSSYKRKPESSKSNSNQSNLLRPNIPETQTIQNYSRASAFQRGSPMEDSRSGSIRNISEFQDQISNSLSSSQTVSALPESNFSTNKISANQYVMSNQNIAIRSVSVEPGQFEQRHLEEGVPQYIDLIDGTPFLEQLASAPPPMPVPSSSFSQTNQEGQVVFTTLVSPSENARMQQQADETFRPTYHGEAVQEIRPVTGLTPGIAIEGPFGFFDGSVDQKPNDLIQPSISQNKEPDPMTLTFVPHIVEDDELAHFNQSNTTSDHITFIKEPGEVNTSSNSKNSFQNSFLSYLQGNKQETLSSVSSSAVTKKPILPKYIPEPPRPRPPPPPPKKESQFSDEDRGNVSTFKISALSDNDTSSQKSESDKEGYSVRRTSDLAVKITLPKSKKNRFGPFAENSFLKESMRKNRELKVKNKKRKGKRNSDGEDVMMIEHGEDGDSSPTPTRTSIGRKAKDKSVEKSKKKRKHDSNGSSDEKVVRQAKSKQSYNSDSSNYDSDKDPVWMPFETDLKPGDVDDKRKKQKKSRLHRTSSKQSKPGYSKSLQQTEEYQKVSPGVSSYEPMNLQIQTTKSAETIEYQIGKFLLEKKDLENYDNYPIWRLENGSMLHKFELVVQDGHVRHQAVGTYSTWMKSMQNQYLSIKVREIVLSKKGEAQMVEVVEEFKPKPPTERIEMQFESDPLMETFNIYLQVLLSQSLEPNFLSAVLNHEETFYMDALQKIDKLVGEKCSSINTIVQWKPNFKDSLETYPHLKEIDRPNLKQPCQACVNTGPPTIKSVIFYGQPYDRFFLTPSVSSSDSQEFMIGKTASFFVQLYHSLYHYKYSLRQRCDEKIKFLADHSDTESGTTTILDKCLENRSWVLELFNNLKSLLSQELDLSKKKDNTEGLFAL